MTRICPKCQYVRKASDECPEWQCPSCQVAYNKAADTGSMQPVTRLRGREEAAGGNPMKWVILGVIVCAAGVFASALMKGPKRSSSATPIISEARADQPEVVMYSTSWCGYCRAARNFFTANGIQFVEHDIEKSSEANRTHKQLGGRGVPLITVGDQVIKGYNQQALEHHLKDWMGKS